MGPVIIAVPARSPVTHWPLLGGSGVERLFAQFFVWSGTHRRTHVYDCEYHPPSVRLEERNVERVEELETWTRRGLWSFWGSGACVKVEVAVLGSPAPIVRPYGLCGRKATVVISASRTSVGMV